MIQDKFPNKYFDFKDLSYVNSSKKRFLFHHIPKTAGSTFRAILENLFLKDEVCPAEIPKELKEEYESGFDNYKLFGGHFSYGSISKYLDDAVWVTFLRNPVERVVSHYYNHSNLQRVPDTWKKRLDETPEWKKYIDDVQGVSLTEWINHENQTVNSIACNRQTQAFLPDSIRVNVKDWGEYNSEYIELAKKNLRDNFAFVGIQENFDLSLDMFSMIFALNPIDASSYTTNLNTKKSMENKYDLEPEVLKLVQEKNRMDIELYEYGESLLFERLHIINRKVISNNRVQVMTMINSKTDPIESKMDINQVYNTHGFYALEGENENLFKWSGYDTPSVVEFLYDFKKQKKYQIKINLLAVISEEVFDSLEIRLDDKKLVINTEDKTTSERIITADIVDNKNLFDGTFHRLDLFSTLELEGEHKGARALGVAFNSIEIK